MQKINPTAAVKSNVCWAILGMPWVENIQIKSTENMHENVHVTVMCSLPHTVLPVIAFVTNMGILHGQWAVEVPSQSQDMPSG